jgi:hypothetical protein
MAPVCASVEPAAPVQCTVPRQSRQLPGGVGGVEYKAGTLGLWPDGTVTGETVGQAQGPAVPTGSVRGPAGCRVGGRFRRAPGCHQKLPAPSKLSYDQTTGSSAATGS